MKQSSILAETLNYRMLSNMIFAGAHEIIAREKELNAINVFPVPDGDTGSNLTYLMRMIIRETKWNESSTEMLESMKQACLRGSRGNSGMIFSQFIISICNYMSSHPELKNEQFVEMCEQSVAMSRLSVHSPKEGTILSVMDAWVNVLKSSFSLSNDLPDMLSHSFTEACISLEKTKYQLDVLKKHNVVDAGAKGFIHFLQGFIDFLKNNTSYDKVTTEQIAPFISPNNAFENSNHDLQDPLEFRYCTEFMFDITSNLEEINQSVSTMGNSIVTVGDNKQGKIHIHTNVPEQVAEVIHNNGCIIYQKVEDMKRQQDMIYDRQASIAIVIDSACDIPEKWLDEYQIHRLPLNLLLGRSTYLDKVTLHSHTFYDKLESLTEQPTTSQPTQDTVTQLYEQLLVYYDHIISIHLSKHLSGTYDACQQIASRIDSSRIHVIDSKTLSGAYGLIVHQTAEAIKEGKTIEEVLSLLDSSIPNSEILVSVPTLKHMIRGGRVSPLQGKIAGWLDMKPIVSVNQEGKSILYGKTFYKSSNLGKMLRMISRIHLNNPIKHYVILHAGDPSKSVRCVEEMMRITGQKPLYIEGVAPVIGLHAGKGAVSVAMLLTNKNMRGKK